MHDEPIQRIIRAYRTFIVKAYCWGRFVILRQRFLDEIGQYISPHGRVLDVGCGFGLFSLYYASTHPTTRFHGVDLNANRIEMARSAARELELTNVEYEVGDATRYQPGSEYSFIYMMDIVHHIPREEVEPLLGRLVQKLAPDGTLLIKDVDDRPFYKRWFTLVLDKLMDPRTPVHYWPQRELIALLRGLGLQVYRHAMVDVLPYPHILYVCRKA